MANRDNESDNVREIELISQVIEDEKLKEFLCTFLKHEIGCDETTGMIGELGLTPEEILKTTEIFVQHGCILCTEMFLLHYHTMFDANSLTVLAELSVKSKQIEMLKIVHNHGAVLLEDFLTIAVVNLDTKTVKYLIFLDVNIDDNDADTLIDFVATRKEGYDIYLILEELLRVQGKSHKFKDALRLANEADNEKLVSYLMRKNLNPVKDRVVKSTAPGEGTIVIGNSAEACWSEMNWRRWTNVNTRILKSLTDYSIISIDLSKNQLENVIPEFFNGQLPMLKVLILQNNRIEALPELSYPCNNQIVLLDMKQNRLKELPFIYLCMSHIERAYFCQNKILRFTFFVENPYTNYLQAASDSHIKIIDLSANLLETMPEEIGQFRRLIELKCMENNIESFPVNWHLSSRIEIIDLSSNRLCSFPFEHPPGLWKMTLRKMLLAKNKFTWIPLFIVKLRMLLSLDLNYNNLHEFPTASAWECQLSELKLANNPLLFTHDYYAISGINMHYENTFPDLNCFEKTLISLDLSHNDLDTVPSLVNCLKNLRFLYLNSNPNLNDLTPELSLLQKLNVISVHGTPLANLPKEYQPGPGQVFLTAGKIMSYLEDIRLNSETLHSIQLVLLGYPSVILQKLELDLRGVSRKKLVLGSPKHENITMFDVQLYPGGRTNESFFTGKSLKPPLKVRVWVIDNIDGFNAISSIIESERTLYIIANDITKRYTGWFEVKEWLQALYDPMLNVKPERISLFLGISQQIEKKEQRETINTFQNWEPIGRLHTTFMFKEGEAVRKEVYQWGQSLCSKLKKVPEYMQKILSYVEEKSHKNTGKEREFAYHRNEFIGLCESLARGHCWSDQDMGEFINLLQSCGYLFHCSDTWANLDNFYFMRPKILYDFLLRFVSTSAITITTECGKTSVEDLKEVILNYTSSEMVTSAILAILEQYELAFTITEKIMLAVQFLHTERPAIIARTDLDFEGSFYTQMKGNNRMIETPKHSRYYCFEKIPRHFFTLLIVYLTSQSKRTSDFQFTPKVWNLVLWKNGIEAFFDSEHILITQANIDKLSNSLLCAQIMRGRKIIDEQTLELRRAGLTYYISVSIYSKDACKGLQRLGSICDIIENLSRNEQFEAIRDSCCRMLPCEGCIEDNARLHMLSVEELLDSKEDSYHCEMSGRKYQIQDLLPEYFLKDQPNHILVTEQELNFDKNIATKIGEGSEGVVYKHMFKGRDVAVKVLNAPQLALTKKTTEFLEMRKEAVFLQKLQHPYLMGIIAVTTSPLCLVLEYAAHSSLNRVLDYHLEEYGLGSMQNGVLGSVLTHQIAIEIASALNYLHRNKIVYFDLKSANVLVQTLDIASRTHVKLTDYGIAQTIIPKGVRGYKGTLGFMAPELYPEQGVYISVNEKVDVYSYAMFLCELLFGRNPAAGDKNALEKVRNGVRPKCSTKEIPYYMYSLIQRCWEQMPRMRPSTHEILQELSEPKFIMKNKSWNINIRGEISGAYQMRATKLPNEGGISLPSNLIDNLFPHIRTNISLINSSSPNKDLSGSFNTDFRACTPTFQKSLPNANSNVRCDTISDGFGYKIETIDMKHKRCPIQDDSAVIICGSTDKETDIILMKMTTGEYYNDIRIDYPCVTTVAIYNSFMWVAASQKKEEPGVVLLFTLSKMDIMFQQEEEDCIRKLIVFPLEETESSIEVNIIAIMTREIVNYQFKITGNFIDLNNTKFDIAHFCRLTIFKSDNLVSGACIVNDNELWLSYGKNNAAHVVMYDLSFNEPKLIGELPPINDVIETGEMIYAGRCVWLSDKRELILWKIDYHTKNVHQFTELPILKDSRILGRNGSILRKCPQEEDSPTRKHNFLTVPKGGPNFKMKSFPIAEECRVVREISHLSDVKTKFREKMEYISKSSSTLQPRLDHINMMDMYETAGTVDNIISPIAMMYAGVDTVWTFLEDGKICIFDANTSYDQLSVLSIIKTQSEYYSAKHMKIPAAVTVTNSHVIIVRKASNKEVLDMDGFDYYVEVWQNLTADEIRCYNRVVLAAHRAV